MKNITTVTIGIPAFNEEVNISKLLKSLLMQKNKNYVIREIIIISDGSTDKTPQKVKQFNNKLINLIINNKRRGQIFSQNKIFSLAKTDIVILLEADTYPQSDNYINELINPIISNKSDAVQGYMLPIKGVNLISKALEEQYKIYSNVVFSNEYVMNPIPSGRGGRAFSKKIYKRLHWPYDVPEDEYAYLWCRKNDLRFILNKRAVSRFFLPQTISDYIKESRKNMSARKSMKKYFPKHLVEEIFNISLLSRLKIYIKFIIIDPLLFLVFIFVFLYSAILPNQDKFTDLWPTTLSTKGVTK